MMHQNIRQAREGDLAAICNLLHQLSPAKEQDSPSAREQAFRDILDNKDYHLAVYDEGTSIHGTAMLLVQRNISHGGKSVGHIENVVTNTAVRGKGVGKKLVEYLTDVASRSNCYKVILNCSEGNVPFYEKCGFQRTSEVEMRHNL